MKSVLSLQMIAAAVIMLWTPVTASADVKPIVYEGRKYIRLDELAGFYGGVYDPAPFGAIRIRTRWTELEFEPGERVVKIGGTVVWLHVPVSQVRRHWVVSYADALDIIDPIMRPGEYLKKESPRVIVLDPGHGGRDPGAVGSRGSREKFGALDIARRVRRHLVAGGMRVYMTRETDMFLPLEERAAKAGKLGGDLFVSIHLNASDRPESIGIETYTLPSADMPSFAGNVSRGSGPGNRFDAQNALLGFHIQRALVRNTTAVDRGMRRARFIVLRNAPCPAALVECGFLSHPEEEKKLMEETYREQIAKNIADGILIYVGLAKRANRVSDEPSE